MASMRGGDARRDDAIDATLRRAIEDAAAHGPVLHQIRRPAAGDDIPFQSLDARSIPVLDAHRREILPRDRGRGRLPHGPQRFPPKGAPDDRWPVKAQANGANSLPFSCTDAPFTLESDFHVRSLARGEEGGVAPVRKSSCSSSSSSSSSSDELDSSIGCCCGICIIGGTA